MVTLCETVNVVGNIETNLVNNRYHLKTNNKFM